MAVRAVLGGRSRCRSGTHVGAARGHAASQVLRVHMGDRCSVYVIAVTFCFLGRALTATAEFLGSIVITVEAEV